MCLTRFFISDLAFIEVVTLNKLIIDTQSIYFDHYNLNYVGLYQQILSFISPSTTLL